MKSKNIFIQSVVNLFSRVVINKLNDNEKVKFRKIEKCMKNNIKIKADIRLTIIDSKILKISVLGKWIKTRAVFVN